MKLIVGLGNPGEKYRKTRHNAGFLILDKLLSVAKGSWQGKKFDSEWAKSTVFGVDCLFLKPQTFMNLSGRSVTQALRFFKVGLDDLIVLHDDIDLVFGRVKVRMGGGHGGHNGIRSIIAETGGDTFARVKLGVGRPVPPDMEVASWVLSDFSFDELIELETKMVDESLLRLQSIVLNPS